MTVPFLRWLTDDFTVRSGTNWLSIDSAGEPLLRVRGAHDLGCLARFVNDTMLMGKYLSAADIGSARVIASSRDRRLVFSFGNRELRLDGAESTDLHNWLAMATGECRELPTEDDASELAIDVVEGQILMRHAAGASPGISILPGEAAQLAEQLFDGSDLYVQGAPDRRLPFGDQMVVIEPGGDGLWPTIYFRCSDGGDLRFNLGASAVMALAYRLRRIVSAIATGEGMHEQGH